jgi:hypothetical protein
MKLPGSTKKNLEQIILSYSRVLPESRGQDSSKGGRFVTPTFCIIKTFANLGVH